MYNVKQKILLCIQNPFAIDNLFSQLEVLTKNFDITIISTNYLLDENSKNKYIEFMSSINLKNIYFIPFYGSKLKRGIKSMLATHSFLLKLNKTINFEEFSACIIENDFYIWQRIILEKLISKKCVQVGLDLDGVTMPLDTFRNLLEGEDVWQIIKKLHKRRELITTRNKKKNIAESITDVFDRIKDNIIDRKILSLIFYKKKFNYKPFNLNLLDTGSFDYKISFFFSSYYFWSKIYNKKNNFLIELKNKCNCKKDIIKNKILYISPILKDNLNYSIISNKIDNLVSFFNKLKIRNLHLQKIDFRFHPMQDGKMIKFVNKIISEKNIKILKSTNSSESLNDIACNYHSVIGGLSGALFYLKNSCNNINVYCLKSLSIDSFGKNYFLKLINEKIIHYNDKEKIFEDYENLIKNIILKKEKEELNNLLKVLINNSTKYTTN